MNKTIFVYDPPMCCSSGVCGPNPDPVLIKFQDTIDKLKAEGIDVERYVITQSPEKFKENTEIIALIQKEQLKVLPVIYLNNKVVLKGRYPSFEECIKFVKDISNEN